MVEVEARKLIPNPLVTAQRMGEGAVLMDTRTGECFELNRIGTDVWDAIVEGRGVSELITGLAERYSADPERVRSDVRSLLTMMLQHGILTASAE